MHNYSVGVALFDYVPVLLAAFGLALLSRGIRARRPSLGVIAGIAALMIPLGGLCKASWKLTVALGGPQLDWLENLLFILMAPGFVAMAFCLYHVTAVTRTDSGSAHPRTPFSRLAIWLALALVPAAMFAAANPDSRLWFFWLLAATTVANAALIVHAITTARRGRLGWPVIICFAYNFAATLVLSGLTRLPPGEATAWMQEGVNLSAQAALAVGCWQLGRYLQESVAT